MIVVTTAPLWRRWELPTWALIVAIYGGWLALTWWHDALPWYAMLPLGAWFIAWHGHLQHEVLHGHPTSSARFNEALVFPSLGLWYPYGIYRDSHLAHHLDWRLTCPIDDPESFYVTPAQWQRMGPLHRALLRANMTLLGRLVLGPAMATWGLYVGEGRRLLSGDTSNLWIWIRHFIGMALVVGWVVGICGMPLWSYLLLVAYPGASLSMLRSYAEHRPAARYEHRIAINRAEAPLALLFLNNNLHAVHHAVPGLAWYELPGFYRERRQEWEAGNGGFIWHGYRELFRRFLVVPKDHPVHPLHQDAHCPLPQAAA